MKLKTRLRLPCRKQTFNADIVKELIGLRNVLSKTRRLLKKTPWIQVRFILFFSLILLAPAANTTGKYVPPSLRNRENMPEGTTDRDRRDENTIRITNLSEDTYESDVRELVSKCGELTRVFVARDLDLNICKGFSFVSFACREDGEKAIQKLNGHAYDHLILKVEWSNK